MYAPPQNRSLRRPHRRRVESSAGCDPSIHARCLRCARARSLSNRAPAPGRRHDHGRHRPWHSSNGKFVCIQVTTRPRTKEMKETFYRLLVEELERACGIAPTDVMVNMVTCEDEDWSFGLGRAQFLTGEL